MSLIVVRKQGYQICIVGDTRLTLPMARNPEEKVLAPLDSIIKTTILNQHICLCFAGELDGVDELTRNCRGLKMDYYTILNLLLKFNQDSNGKTEFILCLSIMNISRIWSIKNGQKSEEPHGSWIGSADAFNLFQEYYSKVQKTDIHAMIKDAFQKLLTDSKVPEVNGFVISISNPAGFFSYDTYAQIDLPPRTYNADSPYRINQNMFVVTHGTAAEGGYNIYIFPSSKNFEVLPIHIMQGNFGLIYKSNRGGLMYPEIIKDVDEGTFATYVNKNYGITVSGRTS
jgi:hypothetical protein